jgi:hypothetical protein
MRPANRPAFVPATPLTRASACSVVAGRDEPPLGLVDLVVVEHADRPGIIQPNALIACSTRSSAVTVKVAPEPTARGGIQPSTPQDDTEASVRPAQAL